MTDLFQYAEEQARIGMTRAVNAADRRVPEWSQQAFTFLQSFARNHASFISEDVSNASKAAYFPQPGNDRAWGHIYRRAQKAGIIKQDGHGRSARRHASICPRWVSLTFRQ